MNNLKNVIDEHYQSININKVNTDTSGKIYQELMAGPVNNAFRFLDHVEQLISKAEERAIRDLLLEFRNRYNQHLIFQRVNHIKSTFTNSKNAGFEEWLIAISEGLCYYRGEYCIKISEVNFPFPSNANQEVAAIRNGVQLFNHSRWVEAYEFLNILIEKEFIPVNIRAMILVIAGQIKLYLLSKSTEAKVIFDKAMSIAPNDGYIALGIGDYWLEQGDFEKATSYYEKGIKLNPEHSLNYVRMGDILEKKGYFENAEKWYQQNFLFESLFKLYGRNEYFVSKEGEIVSLLERCIEINPENEYGLYITVGSIYESNDRFDTAHLYYRKALDLDSSRLEAYIKEGYCFGVEKKYDKAKAHFDQGLKIAPNANDAFFGTAWLCELMEEFNKALTLFNSCLAKWPEFEIFITVKKSELLCRLQQYEEAKVLLKEVLPRDENNSVLYALESLAMDYNEQLNNPVTAIEIYDFLLNTLGDTYKADYYNRVGNLKFYSRDFDKAAELYKSAIKFSPENHVFHRNLALSYKELKIWSEAKNEFDKVRLLDQNTDSYNKEIALVLNEEGNDYFLNKDYERAIECYKQSISMFPNYEIVYKNLSSAWENLDVPNKKSEYLGNAIDALSMVMESSSKNDLIGKLETLTRKKKFIEIYGEEVVNRTNFVSPLIVEVALDLVPYVEDKSTNALVNDLSDLVLKMKNEVAEQFGVSIPGIRFRGNQHELPKGCYVIMLMEIPLVMGEIQLNERFSPVNKEKLDKVGIKGRTGNNPFNNQEGYWINENDLESAVKNGIEVWDIMEYPVKHLQAVIQSNLSEFLDNQEIHNMLDSFGINLDSENPDKVTAFTNICKALVYESVSIKTLNLIYSTFSSLHAEGFGPLDITEKIRSENEFVTILNDIRKDFKVYHLGENFENEIKSSLCYENNHRLMLMEPQNCQEALNELRNALSSSRSVLLVNSEEIRPFVRSLIELEFPFVPVLKMNAFPSNNAKLSSTEIELNEPPLIKNKTFVRRKYNETGLRSINNYDNPNFGHPNKTILVRIIVNNIQTDNKYPGDDISLTEFLSLLREDLFYELGILLPAVEIEHNSEFTNDRFEVIVNDEHFPFQGLAKDEFLTNESTERLSLLGIIARKEINPGNANEVSVIQGKKDLDFCKKNGLSVWGKSGYIALCTMSVIRKNASRFQNLEVTKFMLDSLNQIFPKIVELSLKQFSVERINEVLKELLEEEISVRDLRSILESLLSITDVTNVDTLKYIAFTSKSEGWCFSNKITDVRNLCAEDCTSYVRSALKRYISHKYSKGQSTMQVYLLDSEIENMITNSEWQPLSDKQKLLLLNSVTNELNSASIPSNKPVILTSSEIRKSFKKLINGNINNMVVLGYQELSPEMNIQPVARIMLNDTTSPD